MTACYRPRNRDSDSVLSCDLNNNDITTCKIRQDRKRQQKTINATIELLLDIHPQQANAIYCIVLYCTFAHTHTHTHTQRPRHTILTYLTMNGKCILFEINFSETLHLPYFNSILFNSFSVPKCISSFYFCGAKRTYTVFHITATIFSINPLLHVVPYKYKNVFHITKHRSACPATDRFYFSSFKLICARFITFHFYFFQFLGLEHLSAVQ